MHFGHNLEYCRAGQPISSQSVIVRPQWKNEMRSWFPVTQNHFLHWWVFKEFLFICNKHNVMLKVVTCMKEIRFAQAFRRMFTGGRHRVKILHPSYVSPKLRVQMPTPLYRAVMSWHMLKNAGP